MPFGDDPEDELPRRRTARLICRPEASSAAARIEVYNLFIEFGTLALASILLHRDYLLGLVPYGLPPGGFPSPASTPTSS
ncbi:MAG: hypothetical protein U1F43_15500 [Myxococcota bacterium]